MTTASPAAPDLKALAASYNDGLRRLVLTVAADPGLQAESSVTQYRQKMASLDDQVKEVRSRSAEIQKAKEEFQRLQKELQKRNAEVKTAKSNLEALSQKVGEAAFREFLAGRLTEFPALQTRRDIQQQIDALSQEKVQVDQAAHTGFADKVKTVAHSTALSGRILLQKQKVASADRSLGSAVLETQQDEQVLAADAIDLLSKVREARKAIADCEENRTVTGRQLDDCRSHSVTLGVAEADSSHFDGEYKKCAERLLDLECQKLTARWECGQSLLSSPPESLPEHLRALAVELSRLASEHPEASNQPPTVIADLKEQVSLLHEKVGTVIFEKGLFKDTLSEEFSKVTAATKQDRGSELRQLGKAACDKHSEKMVSDESTQTIFTEAKALELTIKELSGETLVGTDGKAAPTHVTLGGIGCLAVIVLMCCGVFSPVIRYMFDPEYRMERQRIVAQERAAEDRERAAKDREAFASELAQSKQGSSLAGGDAQASDSAKESVKTYGKPIKLDAKGVQDLIDNPKKYADKILILNARWNAAETLRQGREGNYPFEIGNERIVGWGVTKYTSSQETGIRITPSDVLAEFKSIDELPSVGGIDRLVVKIIFSGDFDKHSRLLSLKRE